MMRGKAKGIGLVGYLSAGLSGATTALNTEVGLKQAGYERSSGSSWGWKRSPA